MELAPELHVPPKLESDSVVERYKQTTFAPVITAGNGLTVIAFVAVHHDAV